jgi:hypothetical protein
MTTACRHWWLLETASGPISVGRCKHCGETKEFRNSIEQLPAKRWTSATPLWLGKTKDATKWPVEEKG